MEPKIVVYDSPHWSAIVTFPNGVQVMICDAGGDPDLFETVVVTAFDTTTNRTLHRTFTRRPDDPLPNPTDQDVVGNEHGTVPTAGHTN